MKYSAFRQNVNDLGYRTVDTGTHLYITTARGSSRMLLINKTEMCSVKSTFDRFKSIPDRDKEELFKLAYELAITPLREREDEKRYHLRIPLLKDLGYLNVGKVTEKFVISHKIKGGNYRNIFTESEIATLEEEHNLDSFIMDEVSEDEN